MFRSPLWSQRSSSASVSTTDRDRPARLVHAATQREGVTHIAYVLACWAKLFHGETGQTDIACNSMMLRWQDGAGSNDP
jgi:hypothetical protein